MLRWALIWLFLFPGILMAAHRLDTGKITIDIRRVKLHEDIDSFQRKILSKDGVYDLEFNLASDPDLNLLITDIYTRRVDDLQNLIERSASADHRIKVKYLTGLLFTVQACYQNLGTTEFPTTLTVILFQAYEQYMQNDWNGVSIEQLVFQYPYEINRILLGDQTVFFENSGLKRARINIFRQFAEKYPNQILPQIGPYLEEQFADSLITQAAYHNPSQFYNYAAAQATPLGKKISVLKEPLVQLIYKIANNNGGRLIFPFLDAIRKNQLSIDSIKKASTNPLEYYRLLVSTHIQHIEAQRSKEELMVDVELMGMIKRKAEEVYINEINALHDEPDEVRFRIVKDLTAEELYYLIVTGEDIIYTSSYTGVYNRLMAKVPKQAGDQLLLMIRFDRFKKFIRMAAGYNKLNAFLSTMPKENAQLLMKSFVRGLEKGFNLEDAVDVADSYSSIQSEDIKKLIRDEVSLSLLDQQKSGYKRGEVIYDILSLLFQSASDSAKILSAKYKIPPVYQLPQQLLSDEKGRVVQLVFFYGDKDGKESFANFMSLFRSSNEWGIKQNSQWVEIASTSPKPVLIYANLPLDNSKGDDPDAKAQKNLLDYLNANALKPSIVIHRGHSYHLKYTLNQLPTSSKIVILGSCGSYQNLNAVLKICPDAHIVSSKEVGTRFVNEPILDLINASVIQGNGIHWIKIWNTLEKQFNSSMIKERFENYIPPHKNLGALFIKAYNTQMN